MSKWIIILYINLFNTYVTYYVFRFQNISSIITGVFQVLHPIKELYTVTHALHLKILQTLTQSTYHASLTFSVTQQQLRTLVWK